MADFLLELLSEEIPARMQAKASADLARLFGEQIADAGLEAEALETWATPRRLALIARGLPAGTGAVSEELKGPRAGAPPQALEGFLRKTGLARDQLVERDGVLFARIEKPGRATACVLAEAIPAIVRAFPWPKSMRWGEASISTESLRWVRPLQGIVALLGDQVVEFEIAGIRSGAATVGHRFHHPGIITIGSAGDYVEKLRACHVVLDPAERRRLIAEGAAAAAADAGLALVGDEGLLAENAGLAEWPVALLGSFDPAFLDVPREVIQLTMRTNQKYFALTIPPRASLGEGDHAQHGGGAAPPSALRAATSPSKLGEDRNVLAPNFVCVANVEASDGGAAIIAGNERVLSARLADAKFFWEQDLKVPLEEQANKLDQIVFHEKLGTVADKAERVAKLARWLVEGNIVTPAQAGVSGREGPEAGLHEIPASAGMTLADLAETAARLCKADLVTGLVGEFPELQGAIGGHLARAQGQPDAVADAIRDHYKPVGHGDEVPTAPVTVAVSLADKLDTLVGFFQIGEKPTGSKDPFALRRAALGILSLIIENNIRASMFDLITAAAHKGGGDAGLELATFLIERLKVQQREAGIRHDMIDAAIAVEKGADNFRMVSRAHALQSFIDTENGANLLAGYKRAANILKKENWPPSVTPAKAGVPGQEGAEFGRDEIPASAGMTIGEQPKNKTLSYTPENEEAALIAALDSAEPRARAAVEAEDFEGAMAALASLRAPVDAFFDKVTVNDPDPTKRAARLDLLLRMREAVHRVADFSKIEG